MAEIESCLHLMVTPYQNKKLPIHRWYNFNHSFSRDLISHLLDEFDVTNSERILDPFCGSGTTLLTGKEKGLTCLGLDIMPLSVFISNAKLQCYHESLLKTALQNLLVYLEKNTSSYEIEARPMLKKIFATDVLSQMFSALDWIQKHKVQEVRYFFLTGLLSILDKVAYVRKDGGFLRFVGNKTIPNFREIFVGKLDQMLDDVSFSQALPSSYSIALEGDARNMPFGDGIFKAIISSPPYPNRHDYTRVYMLELLVGFLDSEKSLKELRYRTLCSHVEARKRFEVVGYQTPTELRMILEQLKHLPLPNKQVIKMLEAYFEDMYLVLREAKRVLKSTGLIAFVVGNVRYGGILVPVGDLLAEIGERIGLRFIRYVNARFRGNSPQQMAKFGKEPAGEGILIWNKR